MTIRKKSPVGKKLKLKKETLKDLDAKGKGRGVKGGMRPQREATKTGLCCLIISNACPP